MTSPLPLTASFAESFYAARCAAKLSKLDTAAYLGVGWRTIYRWEKGETSPPLVTQEAMLAKLGVKAAQLPKP